MHGEYSTKMLEICEQIARKLLGNPWASAIPFWDHSSPGPGTHGPVSQKETLYHVIQGVSDVCLRRDLWRAHGLASTLCQAPPSLSSHHCPSRTLPLRMGLSYSGTLNQPVCKPSATSSPPVGP